MRTSIKRRATGITLAALLAMGGAFLALPSTANAYTTMNYYSCSGAPESYQGACGNNSNYSCTFNYTSWAGCDVVNGTPTRPEAADCIKQDHYNCTYIGGSGSGGGTTTPTSYSYYLRVYANGGTIPSGGPSDRSWSSTSTSRTYSYTIPNVTPTRDGYVFKGWYYKTGTGQPTGALTANKQPGDTISVTYSDASLTAVWEAKPSDMTKPTITGANDVEITVGDAFDPKAGVTANDDTDGDVTSNIKVTGSVDTTKPGTYELTYTVSDAAGNEASVKRTVTVLPVMNASMPETGLGGGFAIR